MLIGGVASEYGVEAWLEKEAMMMKFWRVVVAVACVWASPPAWAQPVASVTVTDVRRRDLGMFTAMGRKGYFLIVAGDRKEARHSVYTVRTWDVDLQPMGEGKIEIPPHVRVVGSAFDGEHLLIAMFDTFSLETFVQAFDQQARPAGMIRLPSSMRQNDQPLYTASFSGDEDQGAWLQTYARVERKYRGCTVTRFNGHVQAAWSSSLHLGRGVSFCSNVVGLGEQLAMLQITRYGMTAAKSGRELVFLDNRTGGTVAQHSMIAEGGERFPTSVTTGDWGSLIAGYQYDSPSSSKRKPPDRFFVWKLDSDGAVVAQLSSPFDPSTTETVREGDVAALTELLGKRPKLLIHEVRPLGGDFLVLAERHGALDLGDMKFYELVLLRIDGETGAMIGGEVIPRAVHTATEVEGSPTSLGFASTARRRGWSGYRFSESTADGGLRVVSWSNGGAWEMTVLLLSPEGDTRVQTVPLKEVNRRDEAAILRSTPGHVLVAQFSAKDRTLTLDKVAVD